MPNYSARKLRHAPNHRYVDTRHDEYEIRGVIGNGACQNAVLFSKVLILGRVRTPGFVCFNGTIFESVRGINRIEKFGKQNFIWFLWKYT